MNILIQQSALNPYQLILEHEKSFHTNSMGAAVTFVGSMRDFNDDKHVDSLFLEHYPGMTEKQIYNICESASRKYEILDILVHHRVGQIKLGDAIVVIAVWSSHRSDAFNACRYIINELKNHAPFWKSEQSNDINKWVTSNTEDIKR